MLINKLRKNKINKGAALVEYIILMAIIGVALISVVLSFGVNVRNSYGTVETTLQQSIDTATEDGSGEGGPSPSPGVTYTAGGLFSLGYARRGDAPPNLSLDYPRLVELAFQEMAAADSSPENLAADAIDWESELTVSSVTLVSGDPSQLNNFSYDLMGMTYIVDDETGWGPNPPTFANCEATLPDAIVYEVVGQNLSGDEVVYALTLRPEICVDASASYDYTVSFSVPIQHNGGGVRTYASIVEEELDGVSALQWDGAAWDVQPFIPNAINGVRFSELVMGSEQYSYNVTAGPAWALAADSNQTNCRFGPYPDFGRVVGTHPDGTTVELSIAFSAVPGTWEDASTCFVEFGG